MRDFVINVLSLTNPSSNTQRTIYGAHLGLGGNHVGFVLFNDTVRSTTKEFTNILFVDVQRAPVDVPQYQSC